MTQVFGKGRLALAIAASGLVNPFGTRSGRVLTAPQQRKQRSAEESARLIEAAKARRFMRGAKRDDYYTRCLMSDPIDRSRQGVPSRRY